MSRALISFTPFMVSLFWFIIFVIRYRRNDPAKKLLTWFLAVCSILYFCHGMFFTEGLPSHVDSLWALCSLSVYPIYYLYILALTSDLAENRRCFLVLTPGIAASLFMLLCPGEASEIVRKLVSGTQIVLVCWFGMKRLRAFDHLIRSFYANTEGRDTAGMRLLLIALVLTSIFSITASLIGRTFFFDSNVLLLVAALLFSTMLFSLSYIGYTRDFSFCDFSQDIEENTEQACTAPESEDALGKKIDALMREKRLYLEKGVKISDVAKEIGSCRTYVSNYINQFKGGSFSEYVNGLRIEDAKKILSEGTDIKIFILADRLGFSSEQSFYRNFKKFTGMTPAQWKKNVIG